MDPVSAVVLSILNFTMMATKVLFNLVFQIAPPLYKFYRKRPLLFVLTCIVLIIISMFSN